MEKGTTDAVNFNSKTQVHNARRGRGCLQEERKWNDKVARLANEIKEGSIYSLLRTASDRRKKLTLTNSLLITGVVGNLCQQKVSGLRCDDFKA